MRELQRVASMAPREKFVLYGLQPQGGCQARQEMVALPSSIYSSGENSDRDWEPEWSTQVSALVEDYSAIADREKNVDI
jgi:hypothetical protein